MVNRIRKIKEHYERYERESINYILYYMWSSLGCLLEYIYKGRYKEKENVIKELKYCLLDFAEEKEMRGWFILYLKHISQEYKINLKLSSLSKYSNNAIYYLLSMTTLSWK